MFEAAQIDGATPNQTFWKITLPLIRPILVYTLITSLIGGLQMFDVPQILTNKTGDPVRSSMTVVMYLNNFIGTSKNAPVPEVHLHAQRYRMLHRNGYFLHLPEGLKLF